MGASPPPTDSPEDGPPVDAGDAAAYLAELGEEAVGIAHSNHMAVAAALFAAAAAAAESEGRRARRDRDG